MIDAYFDAAVSRMASVSGVYQYDTGQRLRLRGLPSQLELTGIDNFIDTIYDGDGNIIPDEERLAVVEVHFAHEGDSQADMRLAVWDIEEQCWTVDVPDEYLTIAEPVHAYVTVYHGEVEDGVVLDDETGEPLVDEKTGETVKAYRTRTRTQYDAVFTPIHRSAPSNVATKEQWDQWGTMQEDIEDGLLEIPDAIRTAQEAAKYAENILKGITDDASADTAREAAQAAQNALDKVEAVGSAWENAKIVSVQLAEKTNATATLRTEGGVKVLELGIPKGNTGATGEKGDTGPADCTLVFTGKEPYGLTITMK